MTKKIVGKLRVPHSLKRSSTTTESSFKKNVSQEEKHTGHQDACKVEQREGNNHDRDEGIDENAIFDVFVPSSDSSPLNSITGENRKKDEPNTAVGKNNTLETVDTTSTATTADATNTSTSLLARQQSALSKTNSSTNRNLSSVRTSTSIIHRSSSGAFSSKMNKYLKFHRSSSAPTSNAKTVEGGRQAEEKQKEGNIHKKGTFMHWSSTDALASSHKKKETKNQKKKNKHQQQNNATTETESNDDKVEEVEPANHRRPSMPAISEANDADSFVLHELVSPAATAAAVAGGKFNFAKQDLPKVEEGPTTEQPATPKEDTNVDVIEKPDQSHPPMQMDKEIQHQRILVQKKDIEENKKTIPQNASSGSGSHISWTGATIHWENLSYIDGQIPYSISTFSSNSASTDSSSDDEDDVGERDSALTRTQSGKQLGSKSNIAETLLLPKKGSKQERKEVKQAKAMKEVQTQIQKRIQSKREKDSVAAPEVKKEEANKEAKETPAEGITTDQSNTPKDKQDHALVEDRDVISLADAASKVIVGAGVKSKSSDESDLLQKISSLLEDSTNKTTENVVNAETSFLECCRNTYLGQYFLCNYGNDGTSVVSNSNNNDKSFVDRFMLVNNASQKVRDENSALFCSSWRISDSDKSGQVNAERGTDSNAPSREESAEERSPSTAEEEREPSLLDGRKEKASLDVREIAEIPLPPSATTKSIKSSKESSGQPVKEDSEQENAQKNGPPLLSSGSKSTKLKSTQSVKSKKSTKSAKSRFSFKKSRSNSHYSSPSTCEILEKVEE